MVFKNTAISSNSGFQQKLQQEQMEMLAEYSYNFSREHQLELTADDFQNTAIEPNASAISAETSARTTADGQNF
jgi:hypothetical protein